MTLLRFVPQKEMEIVDNRMKHIFREMPGEFPIQKASQPAVDISEDEKNVVVEVEIPGVKKDDLKITLENKILTISGEKKILTEKTENRNYFRRERTYGSFTRSFTIPDDIDVNKIDAKFENGILNISIAKRVLKPANERMIEIK